MFAKKYFKSFFQGIDNSKFFIDGSISADDTFFPSLNRSLTECYKQSGRLFFIGNGASAAFSNHMALDWSKNGKIIAHSLSDSSLITAIGNDYNYESIFSRFLEIYHFDRKDFLITTSSSGNSPNIINALKYARLKSNYTLSFSGLKDDNSSIPNSRFAIYTPFKTYGMVECAHQYFHHLILDQYMNIHEWDKIEPQNMNSDNFKL